MNFRNKDKSSYLNDVENKYASLNTKVATNAAVELAVSLLKKFSIDVQALQSDCVLQVDVLRSGKGFVPIYQLHWINKNSDDDTLYMEILEPEKRVVELRVAAPRYIKRKALSVENREKLLRSVPGN
jgi:hypothetical protein